MSKQAEFAIKILNLATLAHLEHFRTGSYATHKALEILYNALPELIDTYVEQYQGMNGKIASYPKSQVFLSDKCCELCCDMLEWIDENREGLTGGDLSLENAVADIRAELAQAMYRLNELK